MPSFKVKKPCAHVGCPNVVESGVRYCSTHSKDITTDRKRYDSMRGTAKERGYDEDWKRVRLRKLAVNPLCERCDEQGRVEPAVMVHHIIPIEEGGARLDFDNLMSLCERCHDVMHVKIRK